MPDQRIERFKQRVARDFMAKMAIREASPKYTERTILDSRRNRVARKYALESATGGYMVLFNQQILTPLSRALDIVSISDYLLHFKDNNLLSCFQVYLEWYLEDIDWITWEFVEFMKAQPSGGTTTPR